MRQYCEEFISLHYTSDEQVKGDSELQNMVDEVNFSFQLSWVNYRKIKAKSKLRFCTRKMGQLRYNLYFRSGTKATRTCRTRAASPPL